MLHFLTFGLIDGTRMLLIPPNLTLIFRHKFDRVWGEVLFTFFAWTHWVAIPNTVSPTLLTSAVKQIKNNHHNEQTNETKQLTIDRCFTRQNNHNELEWLEGGFQVTEHWFYLIWTGGVFTKTRLSYYWHAGVVRDLLQLLSEVSKKKK